MTLRDKVVDVKACIRSGHYTIAERVLDTILDEMQEEQQPSWVTIRDKIMKGMDTALELGDFENARTLAQTLTLLPG